MRPTIAFRTVLPVLALLASSTFVTFATTAAAQTAIRCDANGKTTYGEAPCKPGATATEIAPTQESKQQREDGKAAREQIRRDTAAVDKRMDDRFKRDTVGGAKPATSTKVVTSEGKAPKKAASKAKARKKEGSATKVRAKKAPKAAKAPKRSKLYRSGTRTAAPR